MKNIGLLTYRNFVVHGQYFTNIGDYIQTIAGINLIRKVYNEKHATQYDIYGFIDRIEANDLQGLNFIIIPRDNISSVDLSSYDEVHMLMNGYFMISSNFGDVCESKIKPMYDWCLPDNLRPMFISLHLSEQFCPIALQVDKIRYLKQAEPIGCRDISTCNALKGVGIDAYFSGCLTLTLDMFKHEDKGITYVVDADHSLVKQAHQKVPHTFFSEDSTYLLLKKAVNYLHAYSQAKQVITGRLHAYLPCLAMGVPVLFVPANMEDIRFEGLMGLQYDKEGLEKKKEELLTNATKYLTELIN